MAARCTVIGLAGRLRCIASRAPRRHLFTTVRRYEGSKGTRTVAPPPDSKSPVDDYYALLLEQPLVTSAVTEQPVLVQTKNPSDQPASPDTKLDKARIIFGSKLAGPAMRQRYIEDLPSLEAAGKGTYISGVWIPPKPTEPDNCCMSGCVNCVWDGYREELEEWVKRKRGAQKMAANEREGVVADAAERGDEDGMASGELELNSAMDEIPVGIREFMKTEKRLQMARQSVGT